jgi:hypothetical protein
MYEEPRQRSSTPLYQLAPDGRRVTLSRNVVLVISGTFVVMLLLAAFFLGRITANRPAMVTTHTITNTVTTPAMLHTLNVLLTWNGTPGCFTVQCNTTPSFTIAGPILIVTECEPQGQFADSLPTLDYSLINSGGHVADTVTKTCGDSNGSLIATNIFLENVPSGQYTLQISPSSSAPATLIVFSVS